MDNNNEMEWLECDANTSKIDNEIIVHFTLGSFSINKEDVNFNAEKLRLKKGAIIKVLEDNTMTLKVMSPCNCSNRIAATNREERIPKYGCETKCFGVVMVCYYCVYDGGGVLIGEESKICGACVGIPF